jgi:hypothetical protein
MLSFPLFTVHQMQVPPDTLNESRCKQGRGECSIRTCHAFQHKHEYHIMCYDYMLLPYAYANAFREMFTINTTASYTLMGWARAVLETQQYTCCNSVYKVMSIPTNHFTLLHIDSPFFLACLLVCIIY